VARREPAVIASIERLLGPELQHRYSPATSVGATLRSSLKDATGKADR
jgi:hypothetical protein